MSLPQYREEPRLFCVHTEAALYGTKPERLNRISGLEASPLPLAGPETAGWAPARN